MSQTQKEVPRLDSRANKWPKYKVGEDPDRHVPAEAARPAQGRVNTSARHPSSRKQDHELASRPGEGERQRVPGKTWKHRHPDAPVAATRKDAVTAEAGMEVSRRRKPGVAILCGGPACGHLCVPKN